MRRAELIAAAQCAACRRKVGEASFPTFYRLTLERHGLNLPALRRAHGEELLMGSPFLAAALGADEDLTIRVMDPATITICEDCSTQALIIAALAEQAEADRPVDAHAEVRRGLAQANDPALRRTRDALLGDGPTADVE